MVQQSVHLVFTGKVKSHLHLKFRYTIPHTLFTQRPNTKSSYLPPCIYQRLLERFTAQSNYDLLSKSGVKALLSLGVQELGTRSYAMLQQSENRVNSAGEPEVFAIKCVFHEHT